MIITELPLILLFMNFIYLSIEFRFHKIFISYYKNGKKESVRLKGIRDVMFLEVLKMINANIYIDVGKPLNISFYFKSMLLFLFNFENPLAVTLNRLTFIVI